MLITFKKYYRKLEFSSKNFYLYTKTDELVIFKDFYYYCTIHRNTKISDKNDSKWNKRILKLVIIEYFRIKN